MNALHDVALAVSDAPAPTRPQTTPETAPYLLGDLLADYLTRLGIEVAFGIPGGSIEPVLDALARSDRRGGIRPVIARHETGAAFMADGYARETGKLGVCFATAGPGATNMITGVATAFENDIPLLVLTAQTNLETMGRKAAQESSCTSVNTVGMFEFCTAYNSLVSHPEQFEPKLISAILAALRERKPTHLSLPRDVAKKVSPQRGPSVDLLQLLRSQHGTDPDAVDRLTKALRGSTRPVFLLGDGCDGYIEDILPVIQFLRAEIIASAHSPGLLDARTPNYRGVFGFGGHHTATQLLREPDVDSIVAIGCLFDEFSTSNWNSELLLNEKMIQVDSRAANFATAPRARLHILGDVGEIFRGVRARLGAVAPVAEKHPAASAAASSDSGLEGLLDDATHWRSDSVPVKPQRVMHDLGELFPPGTKFFSDSGNSLTWSVHYLFPQFRKRVSSGGQESQAHWSKPGTAQLIPIMKFAPTGWAIGATVGAALANRDDAMVCITGDGSFLMNGQELTVAKEQGLNTVFVILNDSALGMVRHGQRLGGAEQVGANIPFVDFAALARAMGVEAFTITRPEELAQLNIDAMCRKGGPTLIDIRIDRDEVPPISLRVAALHAKRA
ncbi:MAG: thiamine pyrophosphate-binding protein [Pseudomonadota bacterium]|nr:thiamine pyrophosphate-binding protein [Pseudomonadota bacterium]